MKRERTVVIDDDATVPPGRPGGPRRLTAVMEATLAELAEQGFSGLTIERVAERAGVAKTTIYRWWPDKTSLLLDALEHLPALTEPDTGELIGDLVELRHSLIALVRSTQLGAVLGAITTERYENSEYRAKVQTYTEARRAPWARAVERAMERGELPADSDIVSVATLVAAINYYLMQFVPDSDANDPLFRSLVETVIAGVRAPSAG